MSSSGTAVNCSVCVLPMSTRDLNPHSLYAEMMKMEILHWQKLQKLAGWTKS